MVTRFCQTEVQINNDSNHILFDSLIGACSCQCPCRCHLIPSVNEITYCILKRICKNIFKEILREQRKEEYSIFDGGRMKYERIERHERPHTDDGKHFSPSNQRHLSVSLMPKISKRQKPQQKAKSFNGQRDSSGAGKKGIRARKVIKETINVVGSEEGINQLNLIPNFRQQVREGDEKRSSEYQTRKALHGIPLKLAKQSHYGDEADNDRVGNNKYQKDAKRNAGKASDESGHKSRKDKGRNDSGSNGKEKTDRGYSAQGKFPKGKSSLELQVAEIESRDRKRKSTQNVSRAEKASENKFPKETVNYKDNVKQTPSGEDTVLLQQVSAIDKRRKNEISDKIQTRQLRPSNKALSEQAPGKLDPRLRGLVLQAQGRTLQVRSSGHGQYTKDPHGHKNKIRHANYSNKESDDLHKIYPSKKGRQAVDIVVESHSKLDHPPRNFSRPTCGKPRITALSRADAIRPCDYLRALMEDREMCFAKVCSPCPPCRPSTPRSLNLCNASPCGPCQSSIVQCSC